MADSMMTIEVKGLNEMQAAFRQSPQIVASVGDSMIKSIVLTLLRYAIINFQYFPISALKNPKSPRSGFLMGAGRGMVDSYGTLAGKLENVAPYGIYVHEGTSKMQPARPFFQLAIDQGQADIDALCNTALEEITKKLAQ